MKNKRVLQKELQDNTRIEACAERFGTTGDPTRMKVCYLLCHHPKLSVSEIAEIIGSPISTVSHSLKRLKEIQVVENRRQAKQVLYSLSKNKFVSVLKSQLLKSNDKKIFISVFIIGAFIAGYFSFSKSLPLFNFSPKQSSQRETKGFVNESLAVKFDYLSKNGNSSCSGAFRDSIALMPDNARLQGSCCSPMSMHRYSEQVDGLKKYKDISEIPPDPYDIETGLAKKLMSYYDMQLTAEQQEAYDYAMQNSDEKGPCCCKCWRWFVYGGLGKYLVKNYKFTGQQVTEVWNLSDGCGGDNDHHHTTSQIYKF